MSWSFCRESMPVARKEYRCDALDLIQSIGLHDFDLTDDEWADIQKAITEGGKILPGTKYRKVTGVWEGEWCIFRARLDIDEICEEHEIYEE